MQKSSEVCRAPNLVTVSEPDPPPAAMLSRRASTLGAALIVAAFASWAALIVGGTWTKLVYTRWTHPCGILPPSPSFNLGTSRGACGNYGLCPVCDTAEAVDATDQLRLCKNLRAKNVSSPYVPYVYVTKTSSVCRSMNPFLRQHDIMARALLRIWSPDDVTKPAAVFVVDRGAARVGVASEAMWWTPAYHSALYTRAEIENRLFSRAGGDSSSNYLLIEAYVADEETSRHLWRIGAVSLAISTAVSIFARLARGDKYAALAFWITGAVLGALEGTFSGTHHAKIRGFYENAINPGTILVVLVVVRRFGRALEPAATPVGAAAAAATRCAGRGGG